MLVGWDFLGVISKMIYMMIIKSVKDFDNWKSIFDEHEDMRKEMGSKGSSILRNINVPDQLVVIIEWEDMESAKKFIETEDLILAMEKAGVMGLPAVYYLEEKDRTEHWSGNLFRPSNTPTKICGIWEWNNLQFDVHG